MAVGAGHLVFGNRMVGELGKLHFDLHVTTGAEIFLIVPADFLLGALVQLVTIKAADVVERMYAGVPAV